MMKEDRYVATILDRFKYMNNKYYEVLRVTHVGKMMQDLFIPEWLVEDFLAEDGKGFQIVILEAFNKTWVSLKYGEDTPNNAFINKDGGVWCASDGCVSIDLKKGVYYAGDEDIQIGQVDAFETDEQWLWSSQSAVSEREVSCMGMGDETRAAVIAKAVQMYNPKYKIRGQE